MERRVTVGLEDTRIETVSKDPVRIWAENHLLLAFFTITFVFSWGIWLPGLIEGLGLADIGFGQMEYTVLNVVGGFGPSLAAVILVQISEGWGAVKRLLRSGIDVKGLDLKFLMITLLVFPALNLVSVTIGYVLTGALPEILVPDTLTLLLYPLAFFFPTGNHWREEYGWRGYALPMMQKTHGALKSSVALGVAWGIWHLPLFFFPTSQVVYGRINFIAFVVKAVALSCIMTWLYNGSEGRLLTAMLAHFLAGALDYFVLKTSTPYGVTIYVALELVLVAVVVLRYGDDRMASGGEYRG
jgi:membrane protease YdiL (CAAX protease family)